MDSFGPSAQHFLDAHPDWQPSIDSGCPAGWDDILAQALGELHELACSRNAKISIVQFKEKFAELRIYLRVAAEQEQIRFDILCSDGHRVSALAPRAPGDSVSAAANVIVNRASERSGRSCQVCGAAGARRPGGWLRVFCAKHMPPPESDE